MEFIIKLICIALCGVVLITFLRPLSPPLALSLSIICGIILLSFVFDSVGTVFASISRLMASAGIDGEIYFPVLKAVGISILVRISSDLCKDAGQSSLGTKLELAGAVASISVCVPLIEQVFHLLGMMVE